MANGSTPLIPRRERYASGPASHPCPNCPHLHLMTPQGWRRHMNRQHGGFTDEQQKTAGLPLVSLRSGHPISRLGTRRPLFLLLAECPKCGHTTEYEGGLKK